MTYQPLTVQQFSVLPDVDHAVLLDTRDECSFRRSHIPGAQQADHESIKRLIRAGKRDSPVIVYCYHGNSSRDFCGLLTALGFTRVYNLEGGWQAWNDARSDPAAGSDPALAEWLQRRGFDGRNINSRIDNGMSALMVAAHRSRLDLVEQLLEAGADVNLLNDDENSALWFACVSSDVEVVRRLIGAGADLDNQNVNGATCLIYAASSGKLNVLRALADAGADLTRQTLDGFTALDSASTLSILRFLKPQYAALQSACV